MIRVIEITLITSVSFMIQATFHDSNILYDNSLTQFNSTLSPVKYEKPEVPKEPILGISPIINDEVFLDMPFLL